jgi:hypothetical protein
VTTTKKGPERKTTLLWQEGLEEEV